MTHDEDLLHLAQELLSQEAPSTAEVRKMVVEFDDLINDSSFQSLPEGKRLELKTVYKDLRNCLRELENPATRSGFVQAAPGFENSLPGTGPSGAASRPAEGPTASQQHNPYAEQQMEEAEKLFYGGRYAEAIKRYDQVLHIEPGWDRARQHRNESENYLRTGYIPSVALPAEAATAFGKAQSAARLGRYADALALLSKAQAALQELGIQRWQEGLEFEQKLQQNIDAESVYTEGLQLFEQGELDEAIDRIENAARATGLPKYNDKVQELRGVKATLHKVAETLNAPITDVKILTQAKGELDSLYLRYDANPALSKLKGRFESLLPGLVEPMKEQVRSLKTQAERAQTLDAAQTKARQAKDILDQIRSLGVNDTAIQQMQTDLEKIFRDIARYEDELQQAVTVYNTNRSWPAAAARISAEVRGRYPNDPGVIELNRSLGNYRNTLTAIKAGAGLAGIIIIALILWFGYNRVNNYFISLTPTPTATATATRTPTPLPATATPTPKPTLTPTLTPTPLMGAVGRQVWVRKGCYENFQALGQIPAGSQVRFIDGDRKFDNLNRECLLVQYTAPDGSSLIGWILIADLGN